MIHKFETDAQKIREDQKAFFDQQTQQTKQRREAEETSRKHNT